jgi:hypothetical protein
MLRARGGEEEPGVQRWRDNTAATEPEWCAEVGRDGSLPHASIPPRCPFSSNIDGVCTASLFPHPHPPPPHPVSAADVANCTHHNLNLRSVQEQRCVVPRCCQFRYNGWSRPCNPNNGGQSQQPCSQHIASVCKLTAAKWPQEEPPHG